MTFCNYIHTAPATLNLVVDLTLTGKWAQFKWPDSWVGLHILQDITFLELIPILLALCIWAPLLKNSKILFRTDNIALVDILNKRTSKSKRVMSIIRPFVLRSMNYNIQFKAKHIVGAKNNIADALSRFQLEKFKRLAPLAEDTPEIIPQEFIDLISKLRPNVAGQLFCHFDGTPVTRYQFSGVLKKSLNVLGLSQGKYSSHSFRIGAATSAAMNGLSDSEIQAMVKNAFVQARRRPGGINLGLDHIGVRLWWLGKSGMRL
ncbi:Hypothetical predicted protein [Mytilus galloprovincialis]|uniref:Tyr recombinase domain-containing protein n=1 Tax=Mytilus galloprovincialis TaxID=29158 RepID=A0A8B6H6C6_MYTGA|nr:Hypothetical predicted protein [Mytilus galloprovincialis]